MGISDDLASVFDEIGAEFENVATGETERLDIESTDKVGIYSVTLRSNSVFSQGSLLKEVTTGKNYLLYSTVPEQFENSVVVMASKAFLCTNIATVQSMSSVKDPVTRKEVITFTNEVITPCYAVSSNTGNGLNSEFDNVLYTESVLRIVLRTSYAVSALTRILVDGIKYQVSSVDLVRFPGLVFLELMEDVR